MNLLPPSPSRGGGTSVLLGLLLLGVTGCATERQHLLERSAAYVTYRLPSEQRMEVARTCTWCGGRRRVLSHLTAPNVVWRTAAGSVSVRALPRELPPWSGVR